LIFVCVHPAIVYHRLDIALSLVAVFSGFLCTDELV